MTGPDETAPAASGRPEAADERRDAVPRAVVRWLLAVLFAVAGVGHFTAAEAFRAQVPPWMPWPEAVIAVSGVVELALAAALAFAPRRHRPLVGWVTAAFLVAVFPGNVSQYVTGTAAFGLETDSARLVRLFLQPALVAAALWSTGAWAAWRARRRAKGRRFRA
ncbi:hypothetical protein GCM10023168_17450 [Fodinibacter luteus]|uniref:DoxX family membrane protein n=1 Tax=Fodinibacter luteus TaxID=552064 RepID=A0ABP8KDE9_9MICO